ncbi:hypothetical protein RBY4I_2466 [Rhodobacterales bacterium Y4I]|nr:hypothetical protein RBY4I_2466 [Rhodobacterales bacterium Y4I]
MLSCLPGKARDLGRFAADPSSALGKGPEGAAGDFCCLAGPRLPGCARNTT